jgi:hypothetical protein
MDKAAFRPFVGDVMSQQKMKLLTPVDLVVDLFLVVGFFIFMYHVVSSHVPSRDHHWILIWGAIGSSCLTCLFWLAVQMLRVVVRAQYKRFEGD